MTEEQKKKYIKWGIIGGVILLVLMWFVGTRNTLVVMEESISAAWAQVENQLQRRYDLIPNLVNTVKGYAAHEKQIFTHIADARAKLAGAKTVGQKIEAARGVESALSRLLVVVENYPNLKSDKTFTRLMDELAGSENRIAVERRRYNEGVKRFNQKIRMIPANFVASISGFSKKPYFEVQEEAKSVPKVEF